MRINGLATLRRDPEGTPLTAVVQLRLLIVIILLTPSNVLYILSPNQKYNTKNVYGIIEYKDLLSYHTDYFQ